MQDEQPDDLESNKERTIPLEDESAFNGADTDAVSSDQSLYYMTDDGYTSSDPYSDAD